MNNEQWLEERRKGIGGSDASAIIGMNPWKNNVDVWEEKALGISKPVNNNEAIDYGNTAEKHLISLFKYDYPKYKVETNQYHIIRCKEYPFLTGTLDGKLIEKETGREGVLEIKTTKLLNSMHREKWNEKLPMNYYIQVIHYLIVTGYSFAILKAQLKTELKDGTIYLQTKHYHIEREEVKADIEYLKQEEIKFWLDYVVPKKRPPLVLPAI